VKKVTGTCYYMDNLKGMAALGDLSLRLKHMDQYEGYRQVLSIGVPPVELVLPPKDAVELSRIANDEMAEVLNKYPDRFVAALACLPVNDVDATVAETERAIRDLKFKGVQKSAV
jgi:predicted TIM-barrel fold metal-dependent hydrolase